MRILIVAAILACVSSLPQAGAFVIDHRHVELFDSIPPAYLEAARNLRMVFSDRSVGVNINDGLNCLTATSWAASLASCRRDYYDTAWHWKTYGATDLANGLVPPRIQFDPDPVTYSRANWHFEIRSGSWKELTCDFVNSLAPTYLDSTDVLSYQFSYLNVTETDNIADPDAGFFADLPGNCDIGDLEQLIAANPDKVFFFWTTSLARGIGTEVSAEFNDQMRQYCIANDQILFDVADIEAHTDLGMPCFDNRDGVEYVSQTGQTENNPDDGHSYPAICQDYTTETEGGHLGSVSAGHIRISKAFWVLMARIAGWTPGVDPQPTCGDADGNSLLTISDAVYLTTYIFGGGPAPNPVESGDADCNGIVTISDPVYLITFIFGGGPAPCAACP